MGNKKGDSIIVNIYKAVKMTIDKRLKELTLYTEQQLNQLCIEKNWIGNGTKENPIIIDISDDFEQKILIKDCSLYIYFKNCDFNYIMLEHCSNILFVDSSFNTLALSNSKNIEIKRCSISDLSLSGCQNNFFQECTITKVSSNISSKKNAYENCKIPENYLAAVKIGTFDHSLIVKTGFYSILILSTFVFFKLIYTFYFSNPLDIIDILLIIGLTCTILSYLGYLSFLFKIKRGGLNKILNKNNHKSGKTNYLQ